MLPLAARHFAARCARAPSPFLRYASTKPNAKPSVKAKISEAFTEPKPPVLARYPTIYWPLQVFIYGTGITLACHIWCEYFFTLSQAEGISMTPTVNATGDFLLLSKRYRRGRGIEVGDIVSFKHPVDEGTFSVKRVVGMPGDFVLRDSPDTSGVMIQVSGMNVQDNHNVESILMGGVQIPDGHCYVVGDNLKFSRDSRMFGPLPLGLVKAKVIGKVSTLYEYSWSAFNDDGLKPAQLHEDEGVD
ncbi:hypothetical protein MBLNU13_g00590t1 [Cladosporium sp. NU13]